MNLGVAVVAGGYDVVGPGCQNLLDLEGSVFPALFGVACLKRAATTATAVVVRAVWVHVDEIFFTNNGFCYKAQVFGDGVAKAFAHELAGVLYRKFET